MNSVSGFCSGPYRLSGSITASALRYTAVCRPLRGCCKILNQQNQRRVWIFTTGEVTATDRPLATLLDGQFWAESMPVWPVLSALTKSGDLPAAVYLLIDVVDGEHRSQELPCNPEFWKAIQDELLLQVSAIAPFSPEAERTIVAGHSFGGLAALYAGLHWPARFGGILSQSGAFWRPVVILKDTASECTSSLGFTESRESSAYPDLA